MALLPSRLDHLLKDTSDVARDAGHAIMEVYETPFATTEKIDHSPLTEADLASHRLISRRLRELTPAIPILSEEGRNIPFEERQSWATYWLVDPLDGTREFVNRNGEFTVNVALIHDHEPVLGVVWCPVLQVLYAGARGVGAYRGRDHDSLEPIRVQWPPQDPPLVVGSRSHAGERLGAVLAHIGRHTLVSMGSSLKLCLVAEGAADIYLRLGPTSEWDTAAAHAVVRVAGGSVTDLHARELEYNRKASLLNPEFLVCAHDPGRWLERLRLLDPREPLPSSP